MLELFRKYRYPLLAGGLVLVALLFFSAQLRRGPEASAFERLVLGAAGPLQGALAWLPRVMGDGGEPERLREENRRLQSELARQEELRQENRRLTWLLALRDEVQAPTVAARVIAEDAANWSRTVVIDRGREHGIREGMPVLVVEGLVGRIIRTAPKQSRVLLLTDVSSAVAALDQQSRARGICRGDGSGMRFDYAGRDERIELGNAVVTSGTGGVFPRGLIVGRVSRVDRSGDGMFQGVSVVPVTDLGRLEEVLVLLREAP